MIKNKTIEKKAIKAKNKLRKYANSIESNDRPKEEIDLINGIIDDLNIDYSVIDRKKYSHGDAYSKNLKEPFKSLYEYFGTWTKLSHGVSFISPKVSGCHIQNWVRRDSIPAEYVKWICMLTDDFFKPEELNPKVFYNPEDILKNIKDKKTIKMINGYKKLRKEIEFEKNNEKNR